MSGYHSPSSMDFQADPSPSKRTRTFWILGTVVGLLLVVAIIITVVFTAFPSPVLPGLEVHPAGEGRQHLIDATKDHPVQVLQEFIKEYESNKYHEGNTKLVECESDTIVEPDEVCRFQLSWLQGECNNIQGWGYRDGKPCILLTFTKTLDWYPDVYQSIEDLPENMPQSMKKSIQDNSNMHRTFPKLLWVWCEGMTPADQENLGTVIYTPWMGFPLSYFPYKNDPAYMAPIIAIQLPHPKRGVLIGIECRIWAKNVDQTTSATFLNIRV